MDRCTCFHVPLIPVKRRPRFYRRGAGVGAYKDDKTMSEMQSVYLAYIEADGELHAGPISVEIDVYSALPKSRPKKVLSEPFTVAPDVDNIAKAILDSLNGVAWGDDRQVTEVTVRKHDRNRVDPTGTDVKIFYSC